MPRSKSATIDDPIMVAIESFFIADPNGRPNPIFVEKGARLRASGIPARSPKFFVADGVDSGEILAARQALGQVTTDAWNASIPPPEPERGITMAATKSFTVYGFISGDGKPRTLIVTVGDLHESTTRIVRDFPGAFEPVEA